MTTIREVCCDDLLELTRMMMVSETVMGPLKDFMPIMTEFPEYSLVCVSPGNRITGFIAAYNVDEGVERRCAINEMHYLREDMFRMLMKAIEERADYHKVFYVEVDLPSEYVEFFIDMGYTCHKEYFDVVEGELVNKTILRKHLSDKDLRL